MVTGPLYSSGTTIKFTPNLPRNPSFPSRLAVCNSAGGLKVKSIGAAQERSIMALRACVAGGAGVQFSGVLTPLLRVGTVFPNRIGGRNGVPCAAAASKKNAFVYPPMTTKPRWWWRSLACAPYLVPLHEAWSYASHVYRLHPYMEKFDFLVDPFLVTYSMVPRWFLMVIFFVVYYFVGRRKELPHFLRFHIFLALLMSQAVGAVGMISGWMPGVLFTGRLTYLWAALTFVEILTVLHCMKCSLRGMYSDVPFISDSTYINLSL